MSASAGASSVRSVIAPTSTDKVGMAPARYRRKVSETPSSIVRTPVYGCLGRLTRPEASRRSRAIGRGPGRRHLYAQESQRRCGPRQPASQSIVEGRVGLAARVMIATWQEDGPAACFRKVRAAAAMHAPVAVRRRRTARSVGAYFDLITREGRLFYGDSFHLGYF